MLFNSIEFLFIFLPIVFILYFTLSKTKFIKYSNLLLLISSLFFYAYYKLDYLPIIISSIVFNYTLGLFIKKNKSAKVKKILLISSIIGNLLLLCYFKYFNFLIDTFNTLNLTSFNTMKIMLPLGISFFTFQQISYIYDVYKSEDKENTQSNIIDYALFVSFFPQLIAGPICTYKELIPQFKDNSKKLINHKNIATGLFLLSIGLFKKVIIADNFSDFINGYMTLSQQADFYSAWAFAFSVAIQGYFDFSGYCDMAMGIAKLFNIDIPINFSSPYKSIDISEYWKKWHITMGRFLKYHVYIPMGGSRKGEFRTYFNLFFVFLITGIWHGANWNCILYGVINGILVCINKLWKKTNIKMNNKLAILITFITMVFIAPLVMLKHVHEYFYTIKSMLGFNLDILPVQVQFRHFNFIFKDGEIILNSILFIGSFILIFLFKNSNELAENIKPNKTYLIITLLLLTISILSINKVSEFIYFQF